MAVHKYKANESSEDSAPVEKKVAPAKKVTKPATKKAVASKNTSKKEKTERKSIGILTPFRAIGGYFVGSWQELRQVRWPNRKQTWAMTLAVIILSLALGGLIFLLDAAFTILFKQFIF